MSGKPRSSCGRYSGESQKYVIDHGVWSGGERSPSQRLRLSTISQTLGNLHFGFGRCGSYDFGLSEFQNDLRYASLGGAKCLPKPFPRKSHGGGDVKASCSTRVSTYVSVYVVQASVYP
jgi:hypothetical protein